MWRRFRLGNLLCPSAAALVSILKGVDLGWKLQGSQYVSGNEGKILSRLCITRNRTFWQCCVGVASHSYLWLDILTYFPLLLCR